MKHLLAFLAPLLFFLLFFSSNLNSQYRVLITPDSSFRYFAGVTEPDAEWSSRVYDDSEWIQDTGLIGFGYGIEDVLIERGTPSFYIRYRFSVENKNLFNEACLFADYDDGYIAYLNGKEIVRVNVDKTLERPAHNDVAIRSHAIQVYEWDRRYPVLGYFIDSLQLDSTLVDGKNILAVHVLNDSLDGSDLQFLLRWFDITNNNYDYYNLASRYKKQHELDSSIYPLMIIETDEWGIPHKNIRRKALMGIINNGDGLYNHPDDSCNVYFGNVSIEVRGQSSSEFPKRSYRFELIDEAGADTNVSLLGMPAENDWILFGPFHDKAQFRNPMVFDMGRKLNGSYQPRHRFCEVIMNGELLGLYSLMENIKRDKNRVNIAKLTENDISGAKLTGGYIIRYDKGTSNIQIVYPKKDNILQEQKDYILEFMDAYKQTLRSNHFMDFVDGYKKYINDTSLVDYIIVNEITKNADAYLYSTYMYKDRDDRDGRLHFGPLWDYDLAFGNTLFQEGNLTEGWQFDNGTNTRLNITRLFQDASLVALFRERYHAAREDVFSNNTLFEYIDSLAGFLGPALERNYTVWPVIDKWLFYPNYLSLTYDEEIWNIKNWLANRLYWLDANIDDIYYDVVIYPDGNETIEDWYFSYQVYPNPFNNQLFVDLSASDNGTLQLELLDMTGRRQVTAIRDFEPGYSQIYIDQYELSRIPKGFYLMRIFFDGKLIATQRLVKI